MADLGQYTDPQAAEVVANIEDVRGGRGESRIKSVERRLMDMFMG